MLEQNFVEILTCPVDKGPLKYFKDGNFLYNPRLKLRYEVKGNIPILLPDSGTEVPVGEQAKLAGDEN